MIIKYLKRFLSKVFITSPIVLLFSFFVFVSFENAFAFLINFDNTQKSIAFAVLLTVGWIYGALAGWVMAVDSILAVNNENKR